MSSEFDPSNAPTKPTASGSASGWILLTPGHKLGSRYTIIKLLGRGGMGAVYQAWDDELGVATAIKAILLDPGADAETVRDLEQRFKRELLLARQVTHKNVVRIHDMFEVDGIKYLTMPFVDGETLATLMRRTGRLPIEQVIAVTRQVVDGLVAAHDAGVVHRDLKPENIMVTPDGRALVMDFGIARSSDTSQTATGHVIGTMEYMAPEHATGQVVDHRADIYALGLIVYDMLVGRQRLNGRENPTSELFDRIRTPPVSPRAVRPEVPVPLEQIVLRCLQPSRDARFAATSDLAHAFDNLTPDGQLRHTAAPPARLKWSWLAAAVVVLAAAASAAVWWLRPDASTPPAAANRPPMTVLIANFDNKVGDPLFDNLIEQALGVSLESASFINAYSRREALRRAQEMEGKALTAENARLIAIREGINVVLAGAIEPADAGYRLYVRAIEPSTEQRVLFDWTTAARSNEDVLPAVGRMAARIRNELGDQSVNPERLRVEETFTARSLEAAHEYVAGQEHLFAGRNLNALEAYQRAVKLDPELGRAWAGMAVAANNLGRRDEAAENYKQAMARIDMMTEREKFRTRITYYLFHGNSEMGLKAGEELLARFPADAAGLNNLAIAYLQRRQFERAVEYGRQSAALTPKNVLRQNNVALFLIYAGRFAEAEKQTELVRSLNEKYERGYLAAGLSQLALGRVDDAVASYDAAAQLGSAAGRLHAAYGLSDLKLFSGRLADAEAAIQRELTPQSQPAVRARLSLTLAETRLAQQRAADAARLAADAVAVSKDPIHIVLSGTVLVASGQAAKAREMVALLAKSIDPEVQARARLLEGELALAQQNVREAFDHIRAAQKLADSWLVRFALGRAYLAAGSYAEANDEFDQCLKRNGEAAAVFFDDVPTWRYIAPVYYYQGLALEGLKSAGAADAFKTFLSIKEGGDERSTLVLDARKRLGR